MVGRQGEAPGPADDYGTARATSVTRRSTDAAVYRDWRGAAWQPKWLSRAEGQNEFRETLHGRERVPGVPRGEGPRQIPACETRAAATTRGRRGTAHPQGQRDSRVRKS